MMKIYLYANHRNGFVLMIIITTKSINNDDYYPNFVLYCVRTFKVVNLKILMFEWLYYRNVRICARNYCYNQINIFHNIKENVVETPQKKYLNQLKCT